MDIPSLQAFVAVAETASFTLAAEHLFLTQPAVSKRVSSLEQTLGAPLFDRIGRHIDLTEAGRTLLPRARSILLEVEDSRRALVNLSGMVTGPLHIGTSHHIGLHRLPSVLREYTQAYPAVALDIRFLDSEEGIEAIIHGDLELAIVTLPGQLPEGLQSQIVWPDPLCVVTAPGHTLAQDSRLSIEDLARHPAILPAEGTFTRDILLKALAPSGAELQVAMSTNYLETIKMLVSIGLGWSVLPASMLDPGIVDLKVRGLSLQRELGIVWHPARTLSNAAEALKALLLPQGRNG